MRQIVIIGGGVVGSSVAFHLAADPGFTGRITVIERDPTYRQASSALSASSIRQQFSTPVNIAMSQHGIAFLRDADSILAVDGQGPALGLTTPGYLYLASASGAGVLRDNHAVQTANGADVTLLDPPALAQRFAWLNTDGLALAALGGAGEGWFDGPALAAAFRRKARSLGVVYVAQDAVGLARDGAQVTGVRLADGSLLACDSAVVAAGAWSARVAAFADIALPVRARKRMVFVLACRADLSAMPFVIDPTGVWVRREGAMFLCGRAPLPGMADPDEDPLVVDEAFFHDHVWPDLAARVPAFESVRLHSAWAGYYEMNLFDHNAIIGANPACPNLVFACGFSGHGMMHAPATGRGVAELLRHGAYRSLDLSALGWRRVLDNRPLQERNVV